MIVHQRVNIDAIRKIQRCNEQTDANGERPFRASRYFNVKKKLLHLAMGGHSLPFYAIFDAKKRWKDHPKIPLGMG